MTLPFLVRCELFVRILLDGSNTFSRPALSMPQPPWRQWIFNRPHTIDLLTAHDRYCRWIQRRGWMPPKN